MDEISLVDEFYKFCHYGDKIGALSIATRLNNLNKLHIICATGDVEIFDYHLKHNCKVSDNANLIVGFIIACALSNKDMIKRFLQLEDIIKPSLSYKWRLYLEGQPHDALYYLFKNKQYDIIKMIFENKEYERFVDDKTMISLLEIDIFCNDMIDDNMKNPSKMVIDRININTYNSICARSVLDCICKLIIENTKYLSINSIENPEFFIIPWLGMGFFCKFVNEIPVFLRHPLFDKMFFNNNLILTFKYNKSVGYNFEYPKYIRVSILEEKCVISFFKILILFELNKKQIDVLKLYKNIFNESDQYFFENPKRYRRIKKIENLIPCYEAKLMVLIIFIKHEIFRYKIETNKEIKRFFEITKKLCFDTQSKLCNVAFNNLDCNYITDKELNIVLDNWKSYKIFETM